MLLMLLTCLQLYEPFTRCTEGEVTVFGLLTRVTFARLCKNWQFCVNVLSSQLCVKSVLWMNKKLTKRGAFRRQLIFCLASLRFFCEKVKKVSDKSSAWTKRRNKVFSHFSISLLNFACSLLHRHRMKTLRANWSSPPIFAFMLRSTSTMTRTVSRLLCLSPNQLDPPVYSSLVKKTTTFSPQEQHLHTC